jgi:hypothetical protein
MRVRLLVVPAVVLAIVYSCAGSDHFTGTGTGIGTGGNAGDASLPNGGDSGVTDASIPDAGNPCDTQALPFGTVTANDNCVAPGITTPTTASIVTAGCNDTKIFLNDGFNCSGVLKGPTNDFSGVCATIPCVGPLPGTLVCTQQNLTTCNIQICSGTACP